MTRFDVDGFSKALKELNFPAPLREILTVIGHDVNVISEQIQLLQDNVQPVPSSLLSLHGALLTKIAYVINGARFKTEVDLKSDEVKLLIKFILNNVRSSSETFLPPDQVDKLFSVLIKAFENWEQDFELFKASHNA